jgi:copper chaperone CopZ
MKETLVVANIKCDGCATTITKQLSKIQGIRGVEVRNDQGEVAIEYDTVDQRAAVVSTLKKLGYPEATAENGLLDQVKSYASCMIGRIS